MKTKIIINGKVVDAVLDDEQVKAALGASQKHTGLEHPGYDGIIYALNGSEYIYNARETLTPFEFSDKQLRDDHKRALDIYRRLLETAAMLNSAPIDKLDEDTHKHFIYWDASFENLRCGSTVACDTTIFFQSQEAAQEAIDRIGRDDLIWLYRDFQPYIGAYKTEE